MVIRRWGGGEKIKHKQIAKKKKEEKNVNEPVRRLVWRRGRRARGALTSQVRKDHDLRASKFEVHAKALRCARQREREMPFFRVFHLICFTSHLFPTPPSPRTSPTAVLIAAGHASCMYLVKQQTTKNKKKSARKNLNQAHTQKLLRYGRRGGGGSTVKNITRG